MNSAIKKRLSRLEEEAKLINVRRTELIEKRINAINENTLKFTGNAKSPEQKAFMRERYATVPLSFLDGTMPRVDYLLLQVQIVCDEMGNSGISVPSMFDVIQFFLEQEGEEPFPREDLLEALARLDANKLDGKV